jgi:hypothetical protein
MANAHSDAPEASPPGLPPLLSPDMTGRSNLPAGMAIRPRK